MNPSKSSSARARAAFFLCLLLLLPAPLAQSRQAALPAKSRPLVDGLSAKVCRNDLDLLHLIHRHSQKVAV